MTTELEQMRAELEATKAELEEIKVRMPPPPKKEAPPCVRQVVNLRRVSPFRFQDYQSMHAYDLECDEVERQQREMKVRWIVAPRCRIVAGNGGFLNGGDVVGIGNMLGAGESYWACHRRILQHVDRGTVLEDRTFEPDVPFPPTAA